MKKETPLKVRATSNPLYPWYVRVPENLRPAAGGAAKRFFKTKGEAQDFVDMLKAERANYGTKILSLPESLRAMAVEADELLKPFGRTIRDAAEHFAKYLKTMSASITFAALTPEFLNVKKGIIADDYYEDLKYKLARMEETFGARTIAEITARELNSYLNRMELSVTTRKNYRTALRMFFGYAKRMKYAAENVVLDTDKIEKRIDKIEPVTIYAPGAVRALLMAVDSAGDEKLREILPVIAIAAFAGLRTSEIMRLDFGDVNLTRNEIKVLGKSNRARGKRTIKILPNLAAWMARFAGRTGPIVTTNKDAMHRKLRKVAAEAGIELVENGFRHSFASYFYGKFKNLNATMAEMGHTRGSGMFFSHYREDVAEDVSADYFEIFPAAADGSNIVPMRAAAA